MWYCSWLLLLTSGELMTAWTVVNLSSSTLLCSSSKPNSWSEKKGPTQKGKQTEVIKAWDWINIWKSSTQLLLTLSWRTRQVKSLLDASLQFWSNFNTCSIAFSASLYRWKKHTTNSAHVLGPTWNHRMQMIKAHLCSMLTRLSVVLCVHAVCISTCFLKHYGYGPTQQNLQSSLEAL